MVQPAVAPGVRLVVVVQVAIWLPPVNRSNAVAWAWVMAAPPLPGTTQLTATWPFWPLATTRVASTVAG